MTDSSRKKSTLETAIERNMEVEVRAIMSHDKTFDAVKNDGFNCNRTVLHWAAYNGYTLTARALIDRGVHVNVYDYRESTPLHCACDQGYVDMVKLLLEKGANVNVIDEYNSTPLNEAVSGGYIDIAMLLIENGAQVLDNSMRRDESKNDYPAQIIKTLEGRIKERAEVIRKAIEHDNPINDKETKFIEILNTLGRFF